jgi:hypothetical protein
LKILENLDQENLLKMKKYGRLVLKGEILFVFIQDPAPVVEKNDSMCPFLAM